MGDGKTFVGFGFGPIQSGLFVYEAYQSGNFDRLVVAEVDAELVDAVRVNKGRVTVNIAREAGVESVDIPGVEMLNPQVAEDREKLVEAIEESGEMATALPSVRFYDVGGESSVARLIAAGVGRRAVAKPTVIYTAENNNHAAEALTEALQKHADSEALEQVQAVNTVIGKMSGMITDFGTMVDLSLTRLTPRMDKAVLVEAFNKILISRVELKHFERGIEVFQEKEDLLPFEEAKLYGHNAVHALVGYQAHRRGLRIMASAALHDDLLMSALTAFNQECAPALLHKWKDVDDELFTRDGFRMYANDLIRRMLNPHLNDRVARVIRDPMRKLGWNDRLYGTIRLIMEAGVDPDDMAKGAAAALLHLIETGDELDSPPKSLSKARRGLNKQAIVALLEDVWGGRASEEESARLGEVTFKAMGLL